ncbi:MAG: UvrD-helicase domain-containing protein [Hyphomonadaceae bacterium]
MSRIISAALDDLNAEQRAAVEHGLEPLLVIAGAGSGKTKTLSCRVAHLVANGADPSRILLLTFSRRAASEMTARVGKVMAGDVRIPWAGTFHAIGARLLRELPVIGIDPEFTIHDRSDSADLMGMVLGAWRGDGAKRFPMKGTCLAIYSRVGTRMSRSTMRWWRNFRGAVSGTRS